MPFNPRCVATAIGSLPHQELSVACDVIFKNIPEILIWPQLPKMDFREAMEIQFCEGLPCVVLNDKKEQMYFDTSGDITNELEIFYENYMNENFDYFKISPQFSRGIYEMEKRLTEKEHSPLKYFKSQVTGPITIGLGRVDENKRAIYYNEMFRDVIVKGTEMKARWLLQKFSFLGKDQLCFIDEPILSAFGSSTYVSVQRSDVVKYLKEVIEAIHKEGALAGIHCCGNTEWTILIDSGVDIISFDAYEYGETITYYPERVNRFLEDGGVLAWGIAPTSEKINQETPETLVRKLETGIEKLAAKGIGKSLIQEKCLLTPSCGTGSLSVEISEKILQSLSAVSRLLRQ